MSGTTGAEKVYSAIEESARLINLDCSRDKVWPVLSAYQDALPEAVIIFAMSTGSQAGELDLSISVPPTLGDPYAVAVSHGFISKTDHPVGALLSDIGERCPVSLYAIDSGVVGGFKKTYSFFPTDDLQALSKLADIPSMPRSVADNVELFAGYGIDDNVTMVSIDYRHRTVNTYLGNLPAGCLEPKNVHSMLRQMGFPEPSEQALAFARKSFAIYPTFNWDSSKIERICFAVITTDPMALPARLHPEIAKFAKNAPYAYAGERARTLVYGVTFSDRGEYYKLGSYYQTNAQTEKLLLVFDDFNR
jgi:Aromatic prenyltransferase Orf2